MRLATRRDRDTLVAIMRTLFAVALFATGVQAQIRYFPDRKIWFVGAGDSTYVLGVNEREEVQSLYWGGPLKRVEDFPAARSTPDHSSFDPSATRTREEYAAWGGGRFYEPALKVTRADGNRDVVLRYQHQEIIGDHLKVDLKDIHDDIRVTLHYTTYPNLGVIEKHSVITNGTSQNLMLESAQSGSWYLPPGDGYQLTYVSGRWAAEDQVAREPIHPGMKILESRRGNTSHNINPWFMIDGGEAQEESGRVWFGALAWSGNWRIAVEQT